MKVFICHLWNNVHALTSTASSSGLGNEKDTTEAEERIYLNNFEITHTQLWIQGVITAIYPAWSSSSSSSRDLEDAEDIPSNQSAAHSVSPPTTSTTKFVIDDGTSVIAVTSAHMQCHMPNGRTHTLATGDYVMVLGNIVLQDPCDIEYDGETREKGEAGRGRGVYGVDPNIPSYPTKQRFRNVSIEAEICNFLGMDPNLEALWATEVILSMKSLAASVGVSAGAQH